jgi:hypothetical protein
LPVGMTSGDFLLNGSHFIQCIQIGTIVKKKIIRSKNLC